MSSNKPKPSKYPTKRAIAKTGSAKKISPVISKVSSSTNTNMNKIENDCNRNICASVRSPNELQFRCLMKTRDGNKYCPMHLAQSKIIDFNMVDDDIIDLDQKISEPNKIITNDIIRKISLDCGINKNVSPPTKMKSTKNSNNTMREQKVSTIENSHKENEDELEIKLLILANDDEYSNTIANLIGPVFNDITLSEDEQDSVTFDEIWKMENGIKIPAAVNKYYLFSYIDSKGKIRCMTIFTIYSLINENNLEHPTTMEKIPDADIKRAKKLIDLYQTKLDLFKDDDSKMSPEFKLRNRLTKLFKQFHIHSIYLEENWLFNINDKNKLYKIIKETEKLVSNNVKIINPSLHGFKIFQKTEPKKYAPRKGKNNKPSKGYHQSKVDDDDYNNDIFELHEYIVDQWEKLIQAADNPQNQLPIWILASGLSFVVPEVKQKYPDLEIML
jgi:hypothetical protein